MKWSLMKWTHTVRRCSIFLPSCRSQRSMIVSLFVASILVGSLTYFYGTWLDAASEQLDIYLFSELNYTHRHEHFVMYRCDALADTHNCGGLADRLKGIMSIYLWSLLSNRSLLIRITRPCNFVNLLEPNLVPWSRQIAFADHEIAQLYRYLIISPFINKF